MRTELIFPCDIKYHLHKDGTPVWVECKSFAELETNTKMLEVQGYTVQIDNPKYRAWGDHETWIVRNFRFEINVKSMMVDVYYIPRNLGRVARIDYDDRADESGWSWWSIDCTGYGKYRGLPSYLYYPMRELLARFDMIKAKDLEVIE